MKLPRFLAALAFTATLAHAAVPSPDMTGLWYNPSESGWGASIAQQGEVLFVTLFIYDDQNRAQWYVASSVTDAGNGVFSGTLYRTSGTLPIAPPTPSALIVQSVGTVSLQYADTSGAGLLLSYTVSGVTVNKAVQRQTWQSNVARLAGLYTGGINVSVAAVTQPVGCPVPPNYLPAGSLLRVNVTAPATISIGIPTGGDTLTAIQGTYFQAGQIALVTGSVVSGPVSFLAKLADASITNLVVTDDGFVGHVKIVLPNGCLYEGTIGGNR
jgi:hypothetical protein